MGYTTVVTCDICGEKFGSFAEYSAHDRIHRSNTVEKIYTELLGFMNGANKIAKEKSNAIVFVSVLSTLYVKKLEQLHYEDRKYCSYEGMYDYCNDNHLYYIVEAISEVNRLCLEEEETEAEYIKELETIWNIFND